MTNLPGPTLARATSGEVHWWFDPALEKQAGVVVAFSERGGGTSEPPFASLNLAGHVGDDANHVNANRDLLLDALGLSGARVRLTMSEQIHGDNVAEVGESRAGLGAFVECGPGPLPATDALFTALPVTPVALCFADCVPVVLVTPGPVVAVVHAGWLGALASLPGTTVSAIARAAACDGSDVSAYIGAHIGACHYQVDATRMSQFVNAFGTVARAESGCLDLDAVVTASLQSAGVASCNIARLGTCTAEATDRFFSYRAEGGVTGRHAALACIL